MATNDNLESLVPGFQENCAKMPGKSEESFPDGLISLY